MALNAHKEAEQKMSLAREKELAEFIMRDIDLRRQKAEDNGVLAYAKRPVPRGRPNERFLQNTLKNLDFANRRVQEDQMWEQYNKSKTPRGEVYGDEQTAASKRQKRGRGQSTYTVTAAAHSSPNSDSSLHSLQDRSSSDSESAATQAESSGDTSAEEFVPTTRPRGRGTSGSKADDIIGPFLVPSTDEERMAYDDSRYKKRKVAGPERPEWLNSTGNDEYPLLSDLETRREKLASLLNVFEKGKEKSSKREKKRKKEKKRKSSKRGHKETKRKRAKG